MSDEMWVERYRPETFAEVVGNERIADRMEGFVDDPAMPHLLLAGPQGTGKTTLVHLLAKHKYGDGWRNKLLELNASDNRGIDVIREDVKSFAEVGVAGADWGLIFLDEADQLTSDAQPALRRVMEDYDDSVRFILSCNYQNQIIDPVKSRCGLLRFSRLSDEDVRTILSRVADGEDVELDEGGMDTLVSLARGDARSAIHTLQVCSPSDGGTLSATDVNELVGVVPEGTISEVFERAVEGEFEEASKMLIVGVLARGVPVNSLVEAFEWEIQSSELDADGKRRAMDALGVLDWRLRRGANQQVQLNRFLAVLPAVNHT